MKKGFTLIELLVVVLIIGILAAVALPQYQKAVWKSKNAQLKQMVHAVIQAEQVYYLANGEYTKNFADLGIELPLSDYTQSVCFIGYSGAAGRTKKGKDFAITLTGDPDTKTSYGVWAVWTEGPYQCSGFSKKGSSLACTGIGTKNDVAKFCEKIEAATFDDSYNSSTHYFTLP